jgi:hypothetical protein
LEGKAAAAFTVIVQVVDVRDAVECPADIGEGKQTATHTIMSRHRKKGIWMSLDAALLWDKPVHVASKTCLETICFVDLGCPPCKRVLHS